MFGLFSSKNEAQAKLDALDKSQAALELKPDGTIITANHNFLSMMGYVLPEIQGQHHSMFVDPDYAHSQEYREFWARLNQGESQVAQYRCFGKGGREVWVDASYNPIMNGNKMAKVVTYAINITRQKLRDADYIGQIDAIGKSQAVIQYTIDGTVITANPNFLAMTGYALEEIKGRHHSMTIDTMRKMELETLLQLKKQAAVELDRAKLTKGCIELALSLKQEDQERIPDQTACRCALVPRRRKRWRGWKKPSSGFSSSMMKPSAA